MKKISWDIAHGASHGWLKFRGGKAETAKRFDKSDKNAAPHRVRMYKVNLELLADGSPVMVSVFLGCRNQTGRIRCKGPNQTR